MRADTIYCAILFVLILAIIAMFIELICFIKKHKNELVSDNYNAILVRIVLMFLAIVAIGILGVAVQLIN